MTATVVTTSAALSKKKTPFQVLMEGKVVADSCMGRVTFSRRGVYVLPLWSVRVNSWRVWGEFADGRSLRGRIRTKREGGCQEGVQERQ